MKASTVFSIIYIREAPKNPILPLICSTCIINNTFMGVSSKKIQDIH